ncbi:alcohol dehydrogenase [Sphingomonas sp. DBB INV C78]|uniref:SDR family NAD(P)-dependent oxidoreductase n=1 Tax=Sphingomonas sp. DBB INV C78 TaxID=3349434 RepID=UPI0036D2AD21
MGRLDGKVAVILGASDERSMGAATARLFAAEGAKLVLAARRKEAVEGVAAKLGAVGVACDITKEEDLAALAKTALDTYGRLDAAVNYAGIDIGESILESTPEGLRASSDVHFVGTVLFMKQMALAMKHGGSIVTTSSLTVLAQAPGYAAYAGAKGGADVAVRVAANELGERNIRVNSIVPGFTKTAMTEGHFGVEAVTRAFIKEMPLGRFPTVEDVAQVALWLASDEAFVTGQRIDITAGQALRRVPLASEFA